MLMHTKGILVMTPGQRDGAHRQAVAGLLRRRLGRGQLRHRRLRPGDGPERAGAVLGAGPGRRACDVLLAHYEHTYVVPGEPRRAGRRPPTRSTATSRATRTTWPDSDFRTVGDIFSPATNPDRKKAVRHPHPDARRRRPGPPDAGALGRHGRRRDRRRARRAPRRLSRCACSGSSRGPSAARVPAHRRARHLDGGHAVPAVVEEGRAGDQRGERQPAARRAGQPVRLRRVAGLDAQPAAGVRRRDRPGHRQLRRPDRVLRHLALPRRRVRRVLQGAQPAT